jgi:hypothetical protein
VQATFDLPTAFTTDVCVVGGGPSGVAAALSAARAGARVVLVERLGFLGGSATAMQVPAFAPFSDRTKAIVRGIGWEVMTELQRRLGKPIPDPDHYAVPQDTARMDWVPINVEVLKKLYDERCAAAGITVLFHTFCPEVIVESERLNGVVLANKNGLSVGCASVFIDATGDADLAARAGCPFELGDELGKMQGMTLCFTVAGGSREKYLEYVYRTGDGFLARLIEKARLAGDYDLPDASLVGLSFKSETIAGANMGHVYGCDGTDAFSVSVAEREGRELVAKLMQFLRNYVPGQENLSLVASGPNIGIRETRRIIGDYKLTLDDYLEGRSFDDDIARNAYFIDLHAVTTIEAARARAISDGAVKKSYALPNGQSHGIPYRCLLPQKINNLIVAGRALSAERAVQGATRVMPVCFALGEAAGLAAAMAATMPVSDVRQVSVPELQRQLRAHGAWLG